MAKKVTKKEEIQKKVDAIEESENKIDVSEVPFNADEIQKSIKEVSLDFENETKENIEKLAQEATEMLTPIKEITDEISKLGGLNDDLNKKLSSSTPEEVETYINEELKKVEDLQKKVEEITKTPIKKISNMTNWWNGMNYDY